MTAIVRTSDVYPMRPRPFPFLSLLLLVAVLYGLGVYLFLLRGSDPVTHADAVVVLAGSRVRLPVALRLVARGIAPTLVVSEASRADDPARYRLCHGPRPHGYRLICRVAEPFSTQGEARLTSSLVTQHGWRSVVVVSSRYHLFRARILLERCTKARLALRGTDGDPWWRKALAVPLEWAKLARAETIRRGC